MTTINDILTLIAKQHLQIDTLYTQNSDSLDFHNIPVWALKAALEAAFMSGAELGAAIGGLKTKQ